MHRIRIIIRQTILTVINRTKLLIVICRCQIIHNAAGCCYCTGLKFGFLTLDLNLDIGIIQGIIGIGECEVGVVQYFCIVYGIGLGNECYVVGSLFDPPLNGDFACVVSRSSFFAIGLNCGYIEFVVLIILVSACLAFNGAGYFFFGELSNCAVYAVLDNDNRLLLFLIVYERVLGQSDHAVLDYQRNFTIISLLLYVLLLFIILLFIILLFIINLRIVVLLLGFILNFGNFLIGSRLLFISFFVGSQEELTAGVVLVSGRTVFSAEQ